jgi:hypothetical protein
VSTRSQEEIIIRTNLYMLMNVVIVARCTSMKWWPRRGVVLRSRGHLLTTLRTSAACVHAALHITDPFAIIGTLAANLGAFSANVLMVIATDEHEMSRRPANFGARHHQLEVRRLGMLAAHIQTVPHRHR